MTQTNTVQLEIFPKQKQVIESKKRVVLALGAKQSSKTYACIIGLILDIINMPGGNGQWVLAAPTYQLAWRNTRRKFLEVCQRFPGLFIGENQHRREIYLAGNHVVYINNADDPTQWEGVTLDGGMLDDAHRMDEIIYKSMLQRSSIKRGKIYIAAAVPDPGHIQGHWLHKLYQRALAGDPEIDCIQFSVWDNPYFRKEDIEKYRREYTAEEFAAWVEGRMDVDFKSNFLFAPHKIERIQERYGDVVRTVIPEKLYSWLRSRSALSPLPHFLGRWAEHTPENSIVRVGVDPARLGGDSTAVSFQVGSAVLSIEDWGSINTVELENRLNDIDKELKQLGFFPVFYVDVTGLGQGIPDHLSERECNVHPVYYSSPASASDNKLYANKKAELYFTLSNLIEHAEENFCLPPHPKFVQQASTIRYGYTNGKRTILDVDPSPDLVDAVCVGLAGLTHGYLSISFL